MVQITLSSHTDTMVWNLTSSGNYSILSYYEEYRVTGLKVNWDHLVWSAHIPPKFSFFMWLLCHNSMKTKQFLQRRGMQIDMSCCFCNFGVESSDHLFFSCGYSNQVWRSILTKYGFTRLPCSWTQELIWLRRNGSSRNRRSKLLRLCAACSVYVIWHERNNRLFSQTSRSAEDLVMSISYLVDKIRFKLSL